MESSDLISLKALTLSLLQVEILPTELIPEINQLGKLLKTDSQKAFQQIYLIIKKNQAIANLYEEAYLTYFTEYQSQEKNKIIYSKSDPRDIKFIYEEDIQNKASSGDKAIEYCDKLKDIFTSEDPLNKLKENKDNFKKNYLEKNVTDYDYIEYLCLCL